MEELTEIIQKLRTKVKNYFEKDASGHNIDHKMYIEEVTGNYF